MNTGLITSLAIRRYDKASRLVKQAGLAWYPTALSECERIARDTGREVAQVAALVAVTSPRCSWALNLRYAERIAQAGTGYIPQSSLIARSREAAERVIQGRPAWNPETSPKVDSFYRAILGDPEAVAVDAWTYRALRGAKRPDYAGEYEAMVRGIRRAAHILIHEGEGVIPRDLQAILWIQERGRAA